MHTPVISAVMERKQEEASLGYIVRSCLLESGFGPHCFLGNLADPHIAVDGEVRAMACHCFCSALTVILPHFLI